MNLNDFRYFEISAPPSKSDFIRSIAAASLFGGATLKYTGVVPEDVTAALNITGTLGAEINASEGEIEIIPPRRHDKRREFLELDAGESALALNIFAVVASLYAAKYTIGLNGTLARRKFDPPGSLRQFGVKSLSRGNKIEFEGEFVPRDFTFAGEESNQLISAIAFGVAVTGARCVLFHPDLASRGYMEMTCDSLRRYGIDVEFLGESTVINGRAQVSSAIEENITIEGDWSAAANFIVAGAFYKPVVVKGLKMRSRQPDIRIVEILRSAGADIKIQGDRVIVTPTGALKGFTADLSGSPDLFPPAAALATHCDGTTVLRGVHRLRNKESDRAEALVTEFTKLGGILEISGDDLMIYGKSEPRGAEINFRNDHRIAMAALIASIETSVGAKIDDLRCINKSYPAFLHEFSTLLSFD